MTQRDGRSGEGARGERLTDSRRQKDQANSLTTLRRGWRDSRTGGERETGLTKNLVRTSRSGIKMALTKSLITACCHRGPISEQETTPTQVSEESYIYLPIGETSKRTTNRHPVIENRLPDTET